MENENKPSYEELMQAHMRLLEDFKNLQLQYQTLIVDKTTDKIRLLAEMSKDKSCFDKKINGLIDWNLKQLLAKPKSK